MHSCESVESKVHGVKHKVNVDWFTQGADVSEGYHITEEYGVLFKFSIHKHIVYIKTHSSHIRHVKHKTTLWLFNMYSICIPLTCFYCLALLQPISHMLGQHGIQKVLCLPPLLLQVLRKEVELLFFSLQLIGQLDLSQSLIEQDEVTSWGAMSEMWKLLKASQ